MFETIFQIIRKSSHTTEDLVYHIECIYITEEECQAFNVNDCICSVNLMINSIFAIKWIIWICAVEW